MAKLNLKRSSVKQLTPKSRVVKKTHRKIEKGMSEESRIKLTEITNSMRDDVSKLDSLEEIITEKFGDLTKIESQVMESLLFKIRLKEMADELASVGDDAQMGNVDMQNMLQKQQQTMQTMSNVSKMLHDTAMALIRKIG